MKNLHAKVIFVFIVSMSISFLAGRSSVITPNVETQTNTSTKTNEKQDVDTHTITHTVTTKEPNGEEKTSTVTVTDTSTKTDKVVEQTQQTKQEVTVSKSRPLNVSALVALDVKDPSRGFAYGVSVTKEVLGPVTVGLWGLTNGNLGLSAGINF